MKELSATKIPVCYSIQELKGYVKKQSQYKFCLYLAYETAEDWDKSTSRVYMNRVIPKFIYLPVNIEKGDFLSIEEIYKFSEMSDAVVAINQTQPHKSNEVIRSRFFNGSIFTNVDSLIKDENGKLKLYNLNGPSFAGWFNDEVSNFKNKHVIILGVGGTGGPIARRIIKDGPSKIYLVDKLSKRKLCNELSNEGSVKYLQNLDGINIIDEEIIFINCAGSDGIENSNAIQLLQKLFGKSNIFVDLRPQLFVDVVEFANKLGWKAYTGHGMNARNDYSLLVKICEMLKINPPSFATFKKLVSEAS